MSYMNNFKIIKLNAITSTNDYLKDKYRTKQLLDGDLVFTINQTSGRGQRKNKWQSETGESLTFSIFKQFKNESPYSLFLISAVISLAVVSALEKFQIPQTSVKWPNDILSANKKIGGILIENFLTKGKLSGSVIGIGLNLNQNSFLDLSEATSLKQVTGKHWNIEYVLDNMIPFLNRALYETDLKKNQLWFNQYLSKLWKLNQINSFSNGNYIFKAKLLGVTEKGVLLLEIEEKKVKKFNSKDVRMQLKSNLL